MSVPVPPSSVSLPAPPASVSLPAATTYVQESVDRYLEKGYSYSRSANPTVRALENKLTDLEGGTDTVCFGTGMAAINGLYMAYLNAGDHAIVSDVVYGGTYRLSTKVYSRFGVQFSFVDTADAANVRKAIRPNTKLILTETPANPTLKLTDLRAVSDVAREHRILHAVDNTFLTPYYQRPYLPIKLYHFNSNKSGSTK